MKTSSRGRKIKRKRQISSSDDERDNNKSYHTNIKPPPAIVFENSENEETDGESWSHCVYIYIFTCKH